MSLSLNPRSWLDTLKPLPTGRGMVILAGMQKSGTTAITKLLGAATGKTVCSDPFYTLSNIKFDFRERLYQRQISLPTLWRRHRRIFSGTLIKDPNFCLLLPELRDMLPEAQIVFIMRDPRDTIRSILNRLDLPGKPQAVDLAAVKLSAAWRNTLLGHNPEIPGNDYVEVLAWRWRMSAQALLDNRTSCLEIRYEDFSKDKCAAIFDLAKQLGYSALSAIDQLVDVQYQPRGNTTVSWDDFFGATQLATIDKITGPLLAEFGYATHKTQA